MSKELKLIPPNDPRVLSMIAPFSDDRLEAEGFKNRQELTDAMFLAMKKYGGIGLSANQEVCHLECLLLVGTPNLKEVWQLQCIIQ